MEDVKDPYVMPRPLYPRQPVACSREDHRAHQERVVKVESLWFLLARAIEGAAALVVQRYERNDHPNEREGWLELERVYGGREADK